MPRPADLQFTPESVEAMLDELEEYYDVEDLSMWEMEFYANIRETIDKGADLTQAQFDKLVEIYKEYCE